ncbi:MAG: transposase [Planctomycetes bacterium]|nr:transposase [Planctomycetota bacterium]
MPPVPYSTMMKSKDKEFRFEIRLRLAQDALKLGVRPTARKWECARNTVKRWKKRYQKEGREGLRERSHAPKSCPHKISQELEEEIVRLRKRSGFGARRLKEEFDLPCGHNAIHRVIREHGLTRKRKTKRQKKNDLRAVKAKLEAFEKVQMDIKYLTDIDRFLPQIRLKGLPSFQYTIRDVRTGLLFVAYADHISKSHACAAVGRFLTHLRRHGVDLSEVTIQTDNGTEFDGQVIHQTDQGFRHVVEDTMEASHRFIPPGCSNANADVETTHNLIETEFYERGIFQDRDEFLAKAWAYQAYFNLNRKNSYQNWKTPIQRLQEAAPELSRKICLLPPVDLDTLLPTAPEQSGESLTEEMLRHLSDPGSRHPPPGQHQPRHPVHQGVMRCRTGLVAGSIDSCLI